MIAPGDKWGEGGDEVEVDRKRERVNPLLCSTLATFYPTAVGVIQQTKKGDTGSEKMILMTSLWLERAPADEKMATFNPLHCSTLATFFPTAVGQIQQRTTLAEKR